MAERAFFLNTLHPHVKPEDYEAWVRDVDYPFARALPTIARYDVTRIDGGVFGWEGDLPCQFLEVVDVTDMEAYQAGAASGQFDDFLKEWSQFVASSVMIRGEVIE